MDLQSFLIVCPLVFAAGFVDAVAGGGGLISVPAYLFAGLPVHQAIATNKLSAGCGLLMSTFRFLKSGLVNLRLALFSVPAALAGAVFGARLVLLVPERITEYLLVGALLIAAYYTLKKKKVAQADACLPARKALILVLLISFVIGLYDGFYGPGAGTFLILAYNGLVKLDVRIAAGNAKVVNLASCLASLTVFLLNGKVLILLGLTAAVFGTAGSYIGAGLVISRGSQIVRPVILVVLALLFIKTLSGF